MHQGIRILLVDDHRVVREGLRRLLASESGMEVIGEAENGQKALAIANELSPDIIIMDINMPEVGGIESTRQLRHGKKANESPKVITLTAYSDRRFLSQMLKAGASGVLLKESAFQELVLAVRTVSSGQMYFSPRIAAPLIKDLMNGDKQAATPEKLSGREHEVIRMIADGMATKQIARALHLSVKTIETHRRNIMQKLSVDSIADLTKYAIQEGITTLDP